MGKDLGLAGKSDGKAGREKQAWIRYLRAGGGAVLQGRFAKGEKWVNRAAQIANSAAEDQILQEARTYLQQLQELSAASAESSAKN